MRFEGLWTETLKELSGHWGAWWSLEESCTYVSNPNPHEELAESEEDWFGQHGTAAVLEAGYELYKHALFGDEGFGQTWGGEHAIKHTEWNARLGHEDPWNEDTYEVADENYFLTRWNVRWSADGPVEDLLLVPVDPAELKQSNVFCDDSGCPDNPCWPCPDGVEPGPTGGDADSGATIGDTVVSTDAGSGGIPEVVSQNDGPAKMDGYCGVDATTDADLAGDGSGGGCARASSAFVPWLLVLLASMALLHRVRRGLRRSSS